MTISDSIIIALIVQVCGLIGFVFKSFQDRKIQKKENKIIADALSENYAQTGKIKENQDEHKKIILFNIKLKSKLQSRRSKIIRASNIDAIHKSILKIWAKMLYELADDYYHNEYRGIEHEMRDFLEVEISDIESYIKIKIKHDFDETKIIKYDSNNNPTTINFYSWITNENNRKPFDNMELMKIELQKNGFDNPKNEDSPCFIMTMDKHLKNILESYVFKVREWNAIREPQKKSPPVNYRDV
jgi:hypothetical protein